MTKYICHEANGGHQQLVPVSAPLQSSALQSSYPPCRQFGTSNKHVLHGIVACHRNHRDIRQMINHRLSAQGAQ
jgi:hypothetical protein